jgi:hypothetical protein
LIICSSSVTAIAPTMINILGAIGREIGHVRRLSTSESRNAAGLGRRYETVRLGTRSRKLCCSRRLVPHWGGQSHPWAPSTSFGLHLHWLCLAPALRRQEPRQDGSAPDALGEQRASSLTRRSLWKRGSPIDRLTVRFEPPMPPLLIGLRVGTLMPRATLPT